MTRVSSHFLEEHTLEKFYGGCITAPTLRPPVCWYEFVIPKAGCLVERGWSERNKFIANGNNVSDSNCGDKNHCDKYEGRLHPARKSNTASDRILKEKHCQTIVVEKKIPTEYRRKILKLLCFMLAEDRASALVSSRKGKPYEVITCNTLKLVSLHTAVGSSF